MPLKTKYATQRENSCSLLGTRTHRSQRKRESRPIIKKTAINSFVEPELFSGIEYLQENSEHPSGTIFLISEITRYSLESSKCNARTKQKQTGCHNRFS